MTGNPLFSPEDQPDYDGFFDGFQIMHSVSFKSELKDASFSYEAMQTGRYDHDIAKMFEQMAALSHQEPNWYAGYFPTEGGELDMAEPTKDIGTSIVFLKAGEVPAPLTERSLTPEEKELLKRFPKTRQGKRAAMRRIKNLREQRAYEDKKASAPLPYDWTVAKKATFTIDGQPVQADGVIWCHF